MSNPTHVPVRRVRTISAHNGASSVAEATSVDAENADEYGAYEGYEAYEGQDGYEEYDQYEQPQPTGVFSSPARALALGGSVLALLLVFAVAIFILNDRGQRPVPQSITSGVTDVPVISSISQSGALGTGAVPPNFEWTDPSGNKVSLAGLKGKSVWINFWGTWCPPCRAEMPDMEKVYSKHKDDLVILGVSMAPRDDPSLVSEFLQQNKYSWTFIHDSDQELAIKYRAGSIPMSYFIGPDGTVKAVSMGAIPGSLMEDFIAQAKQ
ncbi:MAG TPA: TlpA disulfide reductase family protein [Chloroflexia bacterium]|jgi:thiol-disulfide isomerase/thioredoxin